jgi:selenocysteine lyase/cysteine desulfurase
MGPLPKATQAAGAEALRRRAVPSTLTPDDFFEPAERVRRLCAGLVNADPERVALIPTTSYGTAIVAKNVRPQPGCNVVLLAEQFPSNVHPWRAWRQDGVELRAVTAPGDGDWTDALINAIDTRTQLVAVEQAHWTNGMLIDLVRLGAAARTVGALFVIDATQTAGTMPLDVQQIQPDALIVHSYKAMLCNYGLGFMVLGERLLEGFPLEDSWLMRAGSRNFAALTDYADDFDSGARRYDSSLRASPILIAMLEASCTLLTVWQPQRIRDYLLEIERPFVERMRQAGFAIADEHARAANLFGVGLSGMGSPETVRAALAARHIQVSVRGSSLRVSPHVYNSADDLMTLADALIALRP